MEGRTIVRPDQIAGRGNGVVVLPLQWRAGQSSGQTVTGFNGTPFTGGLQWRAGQSSGQTQLCDRAVVESRNLQWRAGQSSGQTLSGWNDRPERTVPSMEGRTIVRPDR